MMTKPFDAIELVSILKTKGLDLGEECAKVVFESVLDWTAASVQLTENKYDDMLLIAIPKAKEIGLTFLDKIDGKKD